MCLLWQLRVSRSCVGWAGAGHVGVPSPSSLHTPLVPWSPLHPGMPFASGAGLAESSSTGLSFLLVHIKGQRASVSLPAQVLSHSRKSLSKEKVVSLSHRAALSLSVLSQKYPSEPIPFFLSTLWNSWHSSPGQPGAEPCRQQPGWLWPRVAPSDAWALISF